MIIGSIYIVKVYNNYIKILRRNNILLVILVIIAGYIADSEDFIYALKSALLFVYITRNP